MKRHEFLSVCAGFLVGVVAGKSHQPFPRRRNPKQTCSKASPLLMLIRIPMSSGSQGLSGTSGPAAAEALAQGHSYLPSCMGKSN